MKVRRSILAPVFLLSAPLMAQVTPTKDQLVGTWVAAIDGKEWASDLQGQSQQYYLTLQAGGAYAVQAKAKVSRLLGLSGIGGSIDSSTGQFDSTAGESERMWGRWSLVGDSLKFGRDGRYETFRVALQGPEVTLQQAFVAYDKANQVEKDRHTECTRVFTRIDPGQPLPAPGPWRTCQAVASPLPRPTVKTTDLLGTWVSVEPIAAEGARDPLCAGFAALCLVRTDTLTFQADSTLVHHLIRSSDSTKWHVVNQKPVIDTVITKVDTAVVKLRWGVASDTLWASPPEPGKKAAATISFEENGRYLLYHHQPDQPWSFRLYQRVTTPKP